MSKLFVVFGATGQQGGSAIDFVLNDAELSKKFKIRAITRDISKPAAKELEKKGVEVVRGDLGDLSSIKDAVKGAYSIFAVTTTYNNPVYDRSKKGTEETQGKALADAAVAAGTTQLIFSSSSLVSSISSGKYVNVSQFDEKALVEVYIRTLPIKSAFFTPASFMQNLLTMAKPRPVGEGKYAMFNVCKPESKVPWIDVATDSGKWVGAALAEPEKYGGKVLAAATYLKSYKEMAEIVGRVSGKEVSYVQLPVEKFKGFMNPGFDTEVVEMFLYMDEFGYYGPGQEEMVAWSVEQAKGKLTTLEEFLERNPIQFD
ncbi:NAD(P)-binding protein [Aulographum hederae CBS 113979]|uniref:NAD(P)-binding protein n=1 Tax=Aulographum hederae CBS 113979 TaxID=1176131 RepID=A0A6G1HH05_9PEZI|nr:NAD(P)-binding protein [Aulographum hederae CBS 113979]